MPRARRPVLGKEQAWLGVRTVAPSLWRSEHRSPPAGRTTSSRICSAPATTWVPSTGAEGSTPKPCAAWRGPESVPASCGGNGWRASAVCSSHRCPPGPGLSLRRTSGSGESASLTFFRLPRSSKTWGIFWLPREP